MLLPKNIFNLKEMLLFESFPTHLQQNHDESNYGTDALPYIILGTHKKKKKKKKNMSPILRS